MLQQESMQLATGKWCMGKLCEMHAVKNPFPAVHTSFLDLQGKAGVQNKPHHLCKQKAFGSAPQTQVPEPGRASLTGRHSKDHQPQCSQINFLLHTFFLPEAQFSRQPKERRASKDRDVDETLLEVKTGNSRSTLRWWIWVWAPSDWKYSSTQRRPILS